MREDTVEAAALVQMMTARYRRENKHCKCRSMGRECLTELRMVQAWSLFEIGLNRGLLGSVGVGHGKTMLDILAPLAMPGCEVALLLIPATLMDQLVGEYELISQHFRVPSLCVHSQNKTMPTNEGVTLQVCSYSKLSHPNSVYLLRDTYRPDTVIMDECDMMRDVDSVRTRRLMPYFKENPDTRMLAWSGSITDSSIRDYSHLSAMSLKLGSPVPLDRKIVDEWAGAIDPSDDPASPGVLMGLCEAGETLYQGFHRRLIETPGVIATSVPAIDAAVAITQRASPGIPCAVSDALKVMRNDWVRPDGEILTEALERARGLCELACGFYYRWIYPRGEPQELINEWFAARQTWNAEVRSYIQRRHAGLDSAHLCEMAAKRAHKIIESDGDLPEWAAKTYLRWHKVKHLVEPETEAVRVDDFLVQDAARWAHENRGIVWYCHASFGKWLEEVSGLRRFGGGKQAAADLKKEDGSKSIILSVKSHGRGRDGLQRIFDNQIIASPPTQPRDWEQLLGRLHRIGQPSDTVRAEFYRHTEEIQKHVDTALSRALYVETTWGSSQKLRIGFQVSS